MKYVTFEWAIFLTFGVIFEEAKLVRNFATPGYVGLLRFVAQTVFCATNRRGTAVA